MIEADTIKHLRTAIDGFEEAILKAVEISESRMGIDHTGRQNIALFVFAKLIAHSMSMRLILSNIEEVLKNGGLLDHFSLATLGRSTLDASLMTMYVSDANMTLEEWDLRRKIFRLHELFNRKRFLTAAGAASQVVELPFFKTYEERKKELRTHIEQLARKLRHESEKTKEILKGQNVFIDGARAAAREAGWDVDAFDFHQSYLSNWVHSHPVSFLRFTEQEISFSHPSEYQLSFCGSVLEIATPYLIKATTRMQAFTGSRSLDQTGHLD